MATSSSGHFVWHERLADDLEKVISFYADVVGWKTQPFDETGEYIMWVGSQGPLGGATKLRDDVVAEPWMGYVEVEDVDRATALAKKLGARVAKQKEDMPDVGSFAVIADPQGATLSIFQPATPMELHDPSREGEFCWSELITSDSEAAARFYGQLFGWKILEEMDMGPMGKYRIFGLGDQRLGGMMNAPKDSGMRPMWLYYTETRNLEGAIDRAKQRGAKVVSGPMAVPGGARIAQLVDPQGASFALHESAPR